MTTAAFEGFPCYEFEGGRGWLIADVSIECGTPTHQTWLSWLAVVIYPIGLWAITFVLLVFSARHRDSPLTVACSFLYKEYDDQYYWWELSACHRASLVTRGPC